MGEEFKIKQELYKFKNKRRNKRNTFRKRKIGNRWKQKNKININKSVQYLLLNNYCLTLPLLLENLKDLKIPDNSNKKILDNRNKKILVIYKNNKIGVVRFQQSILKSNK